MSTYSFNDVVAAITGIGGSAILGTAAGAAEEGITIEAVADKNMMTIGADGSGQNSLIANESSTVTVRLLKTSPVNAILQVMYDLQTITSIFHGRNVITINDIARGDSITLTQCAFKKRPTITYAKEAGMMEWTWDCVNTITVLGVGLPAL
jgi:Protein of unknown function (DUF3277)